MLFGVNPNFLMSSANVCTNGQVLLSTHRLIIVENLRTALRVLPLILKSTGKTPAPIAVVVSLEALVFDRIMIQHFDSSRPEMAAPGHWKVVSRNETGRPPTVQD